MKQLSAKRGAYRYKAAIRGMRSDGGSGVHMWHMATELRCHSAPPPPVEQYDAWLAANPINKHARSPITGAKLRRAVILRRNGESMAGAAKLIGLRGGQHLSTWLAKLPPELSA